MSGDRVREGMQRLAEAMLDAGCEAVVAFVGSGVGVVAVADGVGLPRLAAELRGVAYSLDGSGRAESIGRVVVPAGGRDDDYTSAAMDRDAESGELFTCPRCKQATHDPYDGGWCVVCKAYTGPLPEGLRS